MLSDAPGCLSGLGLHRAEDRVTSILSVCECVCVCVKERENRNAGQHNAMPLTQCLSAGLSNSPLSFNLSNNKNNLPTI